MKVGWTRVSTWVVVLLLTVALVAGIGLFLGPVGTTMGDGIGTELLPSR